MAGSSLPALRQNSSSSAGMRLIWFTRLLGVSSGVVPGCQHVGLPDQTRYLLRTYEKLADGTPLLDENGGQVWGKRALDREDGDWLNPAKISLTTSRYPQIPELTPERLVRFSDDGKEK